MGGEWECLQCGALSDTYLSYDIHTMKCSRYQQEYGNRTEAQDLEELSSYGVPTKTATGKILHGCAICGRGFETPVEMGLHMLTECENGPKISREALLDIAPTQTEIDEALASIASVTKE